MNLDMLNKINTRKISSLNKLNIYTVEDLLEYYPYRYNVIKFVNIGEVKEDTMVYVKAKVIGSCRVNYFKSNLNKLEFMALNKDISFKVVIFNRAFLRNKLDFGKEVLLIGKYNSLKNTFTASDIKLNDTTEGIEAIYHLTSSLNNNNLEEYIDNALKLDVHIKDNIPEYLNEKYKFISKDVAIKKIHQPMNIKDIKISRLKLIYEELFVYTFKMNYIHLLNNNIKGNKKEFDEGIIDDFISRLSFRLTVDQEETLRVILKELASEKRMNRLVQGDVGSGKTIVAIISILANFLAGYQSAFMAPTEILARQHFESIVEYFRDYGINIALLTSNTKRKNKIYEDIKDNKIDVVIGTHSLLNEKLVFNNLGLVITDEQHRFGVNQRNIISEKGNNADVIYLSATPIPRSYALTLYGDLDISNIKTKPDIRKSILTKVVLEKNIKEVLLKMLEEIKLGHQIFVVSPLIMDNEEMDLNSVIKLKEKMDVAFNKRVEIEILHGKLKAKEKERLMQDFLDKKIKILISTTVIEVGINIPNASMIVIFNAERFGLATLHQLRGRVGRSDIQSYCYLVSKNEDNQRLKVMEESNDGFYISLKDFEQRGQGDLFGIKQSGDMRFKLADIKRDYKVLKTAKEDSKDFIEKKLYKDDEFYENIIQEIKFLD